jgi:virulence-associated protein VapD
MNTFAKNNRMYAVVFDIDTSCLTGNYPTPSVTNAYGDIRKFMESHDFSWQQGSVYFGNDKVNAVSCVLTVQSLSKKYPWFNTCIKDIRMLRIEENNDLRPALV